MEVLERILFALWHQDFSLLSDPKVIWVIYGVLIATIFLENGLIPASFLPGDSLLLLTGALIAKGVMSFLPTLIMLTIAASLGCWLSYLQGRWLGHTKLVRHWMEQLPEHYHQRTYQLFDRHGLMALLIGRFLAFIRTLLPTLAGITGLNSTRFQIFNWLSALLWVGSVTSLGYAFSQIPFIKRNEELVMSALMILPVMLLIIGLAGVAMMLWRNKKKKVLAK